MKNEVIDREYVATLAELKKHIQECQLRAVSAVNQELIRLYWKIGKIISEKQEVSGWGSKIIDKLTKDIQNEFPGLEGFSKRNMFRMRAFYLQFKIVSQAVAQLEILFQIPWGHNILLMERVENLQDRIWYAQKILENGWSRNMLSHWIDSRLHQRQGKAVTNFQYTLPSPLSDLAQQAIKDPYVFDFLTLHAEHLEKDLEEGLIHHIRKFLLELGQGFSFMGSQYLITVAGDPYYIDLLFYHVKLRCYVVIELKAREFKPEDTGQLNFYLSAVDDTLKHPTDSPTIGILLCKTRNKIKAEYAFRHLQRPIGVVEYETMLTEALPEELKSSLPSIQEIEEELEETTRAFSDIWSLGSWKQWRAL